MSRQTTQAGTDDRFAVLLRGVAVDAETRCAHYQTERDVIALRFGCCETYYPCFRCHAAVTDHEPAVWPRARFDEPAVLCGVCRETITASVYLEGHHRCPHCGVQFNPGCRRHHDQYFEVANDPSSHDGPERDEHDPSSHDGSEREESQ